MLCGGFWSSFKCINWESLYTNIVFFWLVLLDTDGFVIPSLGIEYPDRNKTDSPKVEDSKLSEVQVIKKAFLFSVIRTESMDLETIRTSSLCAWNESQILVSCFGRLEKKRTYTLDPTELLHLKQNSRNRTLLAASRSLSRNLRKLIDYSAELGERIRWII